MDDQAKKEFARSLIAPSRSFAWQYREEKRSCQIMAYTWRKKPSGSSSGSSIRVIVAIAAESINAIDPILGNPTDSEFTVERNNGIYREIGLVIVAGVGLIL